VTGGPRLMEAGPRPAPTVRPPRNRVADRLLQAAAPPLILGVCGGSVAWLMHRTGLAVAAAAVGLGLAACLSLAAVVLLTRQARLNPWPALAGISAAALIGGWVALPLAGLAWARLPLVLAGGAAVVLDSRAAIRHHRRRNALHRWSQALAPVVTQSIGQLEQVLAGLTGTAHRERVAAPHFGAAPHAAWDLRVIRWAGPAIRVAVLRLPAHENISNPDFLIKIKETLKDRAGVTYSSLSVNPLKDEITITVLDETDGQDEDAEDRQALAVERVKKAAGAHLKNVKVTVLDWADHEPPPEGAPVTWPLRRFSINYEQTHIVTPPQNREKLRSHMSLQLYGDNSMLRADWDVANDTATFTKRSEFPDRIPHRPLDIGAVFGGLIVIPHATDEDGRPAGWQVSDTDAPHEIAAGRTGTGKSVDNRTVAIEAARQGHDVRCIDPKRVEFRGLRGWPNVTIVATRVPQMIQAIEQTYDDMLERYAEIEEGRASESDFQRIVVIVDEYLMFQMLINDYHAEARARDSSLPKEHPVLRKVHGLLVLGRGANINIRLATQRADATLFSNNALGGVRDQLAGRVALGQQSQESATMMFGDGSVGRDVPLGARAVGYILGPAGLVRAKMHWLPDPARYPDQFKEADGPLDWQRQLLLDMLPPGETWNGPQPYQPPRPEDPDADGEVRPNPATRLMWFVRTALRCREAHLTDAATGGAPAAGAAAAYYGWGLGPSGNLERSGTWMGSVADTPAGRRVYLHPGRVLEAAQRIAAPLEVPFPYSRAQLDEALRASGQLNTETVGGETRLTVRRPMRGHDLPDTDRPRAWDLPADEVIGDIPDEEDGQGSDRAAVAIAPSGQPAPGTPQGRPDPQPGVVEVAACELTGCERIELELEDGTVQVTVDDIEVNRFNAGKLILNCRRDDGTPAGFEVDRDQPIRLVPDPGPPPAPGGSQPP
jgi:DNA translocase FtsK/SpoIIIE-like protein